MPKKAEEKFSLISNKKLLALYAGLLKCRMVEELAAGRKLAGREAPAVATVIDLLAADTVISAGLLPQFMKGKSLDAISSKQMVRSQSPVELLKSALVVARAHQRNKDNKIVIVFSNASGAVAEKLFRAAGDERLPILFVRNAKPGAKPGKDRRLPGWPYGFPAIPVDLHDVVAIYRVASESTAHARRGNGATLIECAPWALAKPGEADSIANMERYLAHHGVAFERTRTQVRAGFAKKFGGRSVSARPAPATRRKSRQG